MTSPLTMGHVIAFCVRVKWPVCTTFVFAGTVLALNEVELTGAIPGICVMGWGFISVCLRFTSFLPNLVMPGYFFFEKGLCGIRTDGVPSCINLNFIHPTVLHEGWSKYLIHLCSTSKL